MRILLKLKSLQDGSYDMHYQKKINGLIYSLLKGTPLENLHNDKNPKLFCFSNIYPIGDLKEGDIRYLIISSPDYIFIELLKYKLEKMQTIKLGEHSFKIEEIKKIKPELTSSKKLKLKTATPIIVRIPQNKYNINSERVEFWKPSYPLSCFLKQLEDNIYKKYKLYYSKDLEEKTIFERFRFIKTVARKIPLNCNKEITLIGSMWEFEFENLDNQKREILEFALDAGFGEKNSYGFGFVNKI